MRHHPLDRQMGLAGIGGTEHGGDAGAGSPVVREGRRESHIFQVFLLLLAFSRQCEASEAIHGATRKYGLLRRFAPRRDENGNFRR